MRIIVTADLHYDVARSVEPTRRLAEAICGLRADALLIVGDVGGQDLGILEECLRLFETFNGHRFFVAGNHDIWTDPGGDSLRRLEVELPALCRAVGFDALDAGLRVIGRVGFVGSMGWYDYGFRAGWLEIPERFYAAKVAPGAAARLDEHAHLLADPEDVPDHARDLGVRWMDGVYVRMSLSDRELCDLLAGRLADHLREAAAASDVIVAGVHHLPFRELVPPTDHPRWAFASAYMGSERFGDVLLSEPKVRHVFTGHSHRGLCIRKGELTCVNIGSTYEHKLYDVLDL